MTAHPACLFLLITVVAAASALVTAWHGWGHRAD